MTSIEVGVSASGYSNPAELDGSYNEGAKKITFEESEHQSVSDGSNGFSSSGNTPTNVSESEDDNGATRLGRNETKNVNRSKILVYLVLLMAAIIVGFATYFFLAKGEEATFEQQFNDFSTEIIESANSNAENFLGKLSTVSNMITAFAVASGSSWPNITVQNFDILTTETFEKVAGIEQFVFAPVVHREHKKSWEQYAVENQGWIKEDLFYRGLQDINPGKISDEIYSYFGDDESSANFSIPIWQVGPVPTNADIVMLDMYSQPSFRRMVDDVNSAGHILLSEVVDRNFLVKNFQTSESDHTLDNHPRSYAVQPVYNNFGLGAATVGFVMAVLPWDTFFVNVLPYATNNLVVQVQDSCGTLFSYILNGPEAEYLGEDFTPEAKFDYMVQSAEFAKFARYEGEGHEGEGHDHDEILHCSYTISVHAASAYENQFYTYKPLYLTAIVILVFFFTAAVFVVYDYFVQRRQTHVLRTAQKSTAIVELLFPKNVARKLLDEEDRKQKIVSVSGKDKLRSFFEGGGDEQSGGNENGGSVFNSKPIADFFPETTIMFADIVGFTAWSSTREPSQVFILLETIYHEFDGIAKKRRVFKVETVGDCYMAVAGLPDPRKDHAVVMARFSRECLQAMEFLTRKMEVSLGPDTTDLCMRVGLHTGPVTAGVLRGDRARFQLFGDTVNMASRMESTGTPNRIQVSAEFTNELQKAGKAHWVVARENLVLIKGKGKLQTYYLEVKGGIAPSTDSDEIASEDGASSEGGANKDVAKKSLKKDVTLDGAGAIAGETSAAKLTAKVERLVEWNLDMLTSILKDIVARRVSVGAVPDTDVSLTDLENKSRSTKGDVLSEVQEIIKLPAFWKGTRKSVESMKIDKQVVEQLHLLIRSIAQRYHANPFHNFEHASHVTMSVVKLFSRIVAPDMGYLGENSIARGLHDHTYGITSDPIAQFAVIFSALIHDVDHPGVPNAQLIVENDPLANHYKKSVAEQNSVDLAWELLMKDDFKDLRRTIYRTETEFRRFRQLVVNTVLATDIMDADLKRLRNDRWDKAFNDCKAEEAASDKTNRKATIVIEHLIQASDVAHTMQHWHVYRKWNARLFEEMLQAFLEGRAAKDPSEFWYTGEMSFLDYYVIPLARKLHDCGVFGVSSDEYLQYALNNRKEWEEKGGSVVKELVEKARSNKKYKALLDQRELENERGLN